MKDVNTGIKKGTKTRVAQTKSGTQKTSEIKKQKIIKSRDRVRNQGEVFTQDREVKNILALTQATDNIYWRFLEPACGNGNFLVEIVRQRLERIKANPNYRPAAKREFAIAKTLSTIYGIDIAEDNIAECKKRILDVVFQFAPKKSTKEFLIATKAILDTNIILGDSLNGKEKVFFVEYNLMGAEYLTRTKVQRKIYNLVDMENGINKPIDTLPLSTPANLTSVSFTQYLNDDKTDQSTQTGLFNMETETT